MYTVGRLPLLLAGCTRQLDGQDFESGRVRDLVPQAQEPGVEVGAAQKRADADQSRFADDQQRSNLWEKHMSANPCQTQFYTKETHFNINRTHFRTVS